MALANLGSIANRVYRKFDNLSVNVSGELLEIAQEEMLYMQEYTGQTIGSVSIAEKWQPALIALTTAGAVDYMYTFGDSSNEIRLGEFVVKKGSDNNIKVSNMIRERAVDKLKALGKNMRFKQVLG